MRKFKYLDPPDENNPNGVERVFTEEEIKAIYYPFWKSKMDEHNILNDCDKSFESCLQDWIIINWAEEIKDES